MLKKKLKKIIMIALLVSTLFFTVAKADTINNNYSKTSKQPITYSQQIKHSKPKVLIYHSHTHERYQDATIYDIGEDLAIKLETKGCIVEHIRTNFSTDYNKSYKESRKMLLSKNLDEYALIIDLHRDSGDKSTTTIINGNKVARTMFVGAYENPNRDSALHITDTINKELDSQGKNIHKATFEKHRKSINVYNADLSDNMILLELGNLHNRKIECENTNTYLSQAIVTYLNNNIDK